jgi:REP element-mobilizing transposase RayT
VKRDVPNLRRRRVFRELRAALTRGREKPGFRLCQFNVLGNHLHLVVEADDRVRLARGMQGLAIRLARATNRACGRTGKVFADRYHARRLATPTEVRNALRYVLLNARRHDPDRTARWGEPSALIDYYSSAAYFDGWTHLPRGTETLRTDPAPNAEPTTWLLGRGWRRAGPLNPRARPPAPAPEWPA